MSLLAFGMANPTTPLYEQNTPVLSGQLFEDGVLKADPLPVNGKVEYQLIPPIFTDSTRPIVDILIDTTVLFSVDCPAGEIDNSQIEITLAGNLDRETNFDRDIRCSGYTGFVSGIKNTFFSVNGLLKIEYNQPILIRIERLGGNELVGMNVTNVYRKIKKLD